MLRASTKTNVDIEYEIALSKNTRLYTQQHMWYVYVYVAYAYVDAVKTAFGKKFQQHDGLTNWPIDGLMDRPTEGPTELLIESHIRD